MVRAGGVQGNVLCVVWQAVQTVGTQCKVGRSHPGGEWWEFKVVRKGL